MGIVKRRAMKFACAFILCVLVIAIRSQEEEVNVERLMKDMSVIPDVLKEAPKELLKLRYGNDIDIRGGKTYTPTELKLEPKLEWNADAKTFYTVVMLSPDAPSRDNPMYRSWLHWLVVNVAGKEVRQGQTMAEYFGPLAPKDSGQLRYVVLVYQQKEKMEFEEKKIELNNAEGHSNFDVEKFAQKYEMGVPVAGNVFQSKWDEYVPELMKMLYDMSE